MMSERDPRYDPRTLLASASESDADTESQRLAIKTFHSLSSKIGENKTSIMFFSSVVETMEGSSPEDPVVQHAKSQIDLCEKNIGRLNEKISSLLESGVLDPVVHKLSDKMMEEDIARLMHKKNVKNDSFQNKPGCIDMPYNEERNTSFHNKEHPESSRTIPIVKNTTDTWKKRNDITEEKANVFVSFLSSVLAFIVYYIVFAVGTVISAFVFLLLSKIPVISSIVNYLFYMRGDNAGILSYIIGAILSFLVVFKILSAMLKNDKTQKLAFFIAGIILIVLNVMFLIVNIAYGDAFFVNIVNIFVSIGFIKVGKE